MEVVESLDILVLFRVVIPPPSPPRSGSVSILKFNRAFDFIHLHFMSHRCIIFIYVNAGEEENKPKRLKSIHLVDSEMVTFKGTQIPGNWSFLKVFTFK